MDTASMFRRRQNGIVSIGRERIDKAGISAVSQAERTMAGIFPFALSKPSCIGFRKENSERRSRRTIVDFSYNRKQIRFVAKIFSKKKKKRKKILELFLSPRRSNVWKTYFVLKRLFSLGGTRLTVNFHKGEFYRPFLIYFMVLITTLRLLTVVLWGLATLNQSRA